MARIEPLQGFKAGFFAWVVQRMARFAFGTELNPIKAQAHFPRAMKASFLSNAYIQGGRSAIGKDMVELLRVRVAAAEWLPILNGHACRSWR